MNVYTKFYSEYGAKLLIIEKVEEKCTEKELETIE